jgi:hypothetical protein
MAGDDATSADFSTAYDASAREATGALVDLTHAFTGAGRLLAATGAHHVRAEAAAAGRSYDDAGRPDDGAFARIVPPTVPSSIGADEPSLGVVDAWILDQVEGFVWPGADVAALHVAADAWRQAAASTSRLADYVDVAVTLVEAQRSPEVPLAVDALAELATLVGDTAWHLSTLATACDEYAAAVEAARDRTRALLGEVAQMIVEGAVISVIAAGISGGLAGGAAGAAAAARVRSVAPRFYALLVTLRAGAATAAARLERAADELSAVRTKLEKFLRVPARGESGTIKHPGGWLPDRLARAARHLGDPRRFDPNSLRGLSADDLSRVLAEWNEVPARSGTGRKFLDPEHLGRQIRVMDGYPGNRPDPITHGPYAVVSQNGMKFKIPLKGNPLL